MKKLRFYVFFERGNAMYETFEKLLKEKGVRAAEVSRETGISTSTFTDWKKGRGTPKVDKLQKIADYFNVPISYFISDVKKSRQLDGYYINDETAQIAQEIFENKEIRALLDLARKSAPEDIKTAYNVLAALKQKENG